MLAPLALGLLFFIYSAVSGIIAINTTKIPKDFKKVSLKISNYEIKQISTNGDQVEWILKSSHAYASSDESKAKIIEPYLIYYQAGKEKFKIRSKVAYLNKVDQEVLLINGVTLDSADGKYSIKAGTLKFAESNKFLNLEDNWTLVTDDGSTVKGNSGLVSKDFKSITSINDASLTKKDGDSSIVITGQKIELQSESETPIIASNSAVLHMSSTQKLYANLIKIKKNGYVYANSNVRVVTPKMICQSQTLEVIPKKEDKKPKTAIFKGNPHITQNDHTIYADLITYDFATEAAAFEGHVHSAE